MALCPLTMGSRGRRALAAGGAGRLGVRIATAALGIPLLLAILLAGGWWLFALCVLLAGLGFWEYAQMWQQRKVVVGWAPGLAAVLAFLSWAELGGSATALGAALTFSLLGLMAWGVLAHRRLSPESAMVTVMGVLYTGWLFAHLVLLRALQFPGHYPSPVIAGRTWPAGFLLVMFALLVTWATDTAAFFAGTAIGGPKLAPRLSPGKTVSGAVAGTILAAATGGWLGGVLSLGVWPGAGLAAVLSVAGQIGDLAESALKRHTGVKDSGTLLPGHGGVLDRFDSTLFVAPVLYYALRWWFGLELGGM